MLSPALSSLFDTPEDRAVRHVYDVLRDGWQGLQPSARQRLILREVTDHHRGLAKAIPLGRLCELVKTTPREIKAEVRDLRLLFRAPIGSSRSDEGGYYLITTKEEALDTARPFIRQGKSEFAIARAILEPHGLAEFDGQLRLLGSEAER